MLYMLGSHHVNRGKMHKSIRGFSLTSALDWVVCQLHAPTVVPREIKTDTNFARGWLGPRAGLDGSGKFRLHRASIPVPFSP